MLNIPVERSQADGLQEEYSDIARLDCSVEPDRARQEFKKEADVNNILKRFGVTGHNLVPIFTQTDYQMDLQQALHTIKDAQVAYNALPPATKQKYRNLDELFAAAEDGTLELEKPPVDENPDTPPVTP